MARIDTPSDPRSSDDKRGEIAHRREMKRLSTLARTEPQSARKLDGPNIEWWKTAAGVVRVKRQPSAKGPRLLFATDGPNTIEHYEALLATLDGRADVVVYEPPGTGGSAPAADFGFRAHDFMLNAEEVLERSGPRVLVFPCYMSFVAGAMARSGRSDVLGVVLPQGPSQAQMERWMDRVDPRRIIRTPGIGQLLLRTSARRVARGWYKGSASPKHRGRLSATADEVLKKGGYFCLASLCQNFTKDTRQTEELGKVPSVVVWGDLDRSHGKPESVTYPEADSVAHFTECGHSPEIEAPSVFAEFVLGWCQRAGLSNA